MDSKINLRYSSNERDVIAGVGDRLLLMAGPEGLDRLSKKGSSYILGNVKNGYGIKTADTITDDRIDDWIVFTRKVFFYSRFGARSDYCGRKK